MYLPGVPRHEILSANCKINKEINGRVSYNAATLTGVIQTKFTNQEAEQEGQIPTFFNLANQLS